MQDNEHIILKIKTIPKACNARIGEPIMHRGVEYLKIYVNAAPEKLKANKELISLLAQHIGASASQISIISGEKLQFKTLKIFKPTKDNIEIINKFFQKKQLSFL